MATPLPLYHEASEAASPLELSPEFRELTEAPSTEALFALARQVVEDPSYPTARAWARSGGSAVGCFPVYTPQEIVHSFGLLPVSLHGGGENLEISHADAALGSFLCSISKSTLELALTRRLAPFRAFVFPYICDVSRNLEGLFGRLLPETTTHMLHLPQNFRSGAAVPFLRAEYARLVAKLERTSGAPFRPEALRDSIELFNTQRERVAELLRLQRAEPGRVSLLESYLVRRLGGLLPREVHLRVLDRVLASVRERAYRPKDAVRVLLVGPFCEQPTPELLDLLEQVGCYVVDDELLQLHRWHGRVEAGDDPLTSLARTYVESPVDIGVRAAPTTKREAILARVAAANAQAVVFLTAKFCEPALEDVVLYRRALEQAKIPYLHLEFEERSTAYEQSRLQLETFVESILFA